MRYGASIVVAVGLLSGCGSGSSGQLPVNGIVTMDDQPLDGAAVTFFPEEKTGAVGGSAMTGNDGKFVILGPKGERGLVPGTYKVTVSKRKGGAVTDEPVIAAPSEAELRADDLPAIYSDRNQTKLSYAVTGDGQPIEIKLSSKKK
jgi:hypothetical protein